MIPQKKFDSINSPVQINVWITYNPIYQKEIYYYGFLNEDNRKILGYSQDNIEGDFIKNLIENGDIFFNYIENWRKKVPIINEIPRKEIITDNFIPEKYKGKYYQKILEPSDLEKLTNLIREI
ncbi:MAG: hypothetical protein PHF86_13755 [Candidatus Nanoarchaeia archaeon]|nr:hypothetical protein [Candidatus Nanoarchaeia archaeon]